MEAKEIPTETNRFSLEDEEMGPSPIADILLAMLARYAPARTLREDAVASPAGRGISTVTVVEIGA